MTDLLRRHWLTLLVVAWGVLLLVLAVGVPGDATVPEQRDAAAARVSVDRVTGDLVRAAGGRVAVRLSGYEYLGECRISLVRPGGEYRRRVEFVTPPGNEDAVLASIARRLPASYRVSSYDADGRHWLRASGPGFVEVRGHTGRGTVRLDTRTGCRPLAGIATLRTRPSPTERRRVAAVLDRVGVAITGRARWTTGSLQCGHGTVRWVEVTVPGTPGRPLARAAVPATPGTRVLARDARRLAYRQGGLSVVAEARDTSLRVTTTVVGC